MPVFKRSIMQKDNLIHAGASKRKKMALGKGLGALIPDIGTLDEDAGDFFYCDIDRIRPNRFQPRRHFPEAEMEELSKSIEAQGVLQPILVRKDDSGFELIAGERRLRAARKAGLNQVPVVVKHIDDAELLEISIVENIQREDFNPIEEAEAYHRLISEFNLTQDQAATRVGKSRSAVANFLRLRQLPDQIKDSMVAGDLSMGHARALLGVENPAQQLATWREVISKSLSVRQTEALIRRLKSVRPKPQPAPPDTETAYYRDVAENLSRHFGTKVVINKRGQRGKLEIQFYSDSDLDRLLNLLVATKD
jgi:ParB family chromosome partitioning protein